MFLLKQLAPLLCTRPSKRVPTTCKRSPRASRKPGYGYYLAKYADIVLFYRAVSSTGTVYLIPVVRRLFRAASSRRVSRKKRNQNTENNPIPRSRLACNDRLDELPATRRRTRNGNAARETWPPVMEFTWNTCAGHARTHARTHKRNGESPAAVAQVPPSGNALLHPRSLPPPLPPRLFVHRWRAGHGVERAATAVRKYLTDALRAAATLRRVGSAVERRGRGGEQGDFRCRARVTT